MIHYDYTETIQERVDRLFQSEELASLSYWVLTEHELVDEDEPDPPIHDFLIIIYE